jgi:hypothetical protein
MLVSRIGPPQVEQIGSLKGGGPGDFGGGVCALGIIGSNDDDPVRRSPSRPLPTLQGSATELFNHQVHNLKRAGEAN